MKQVWINRIVSELSKKHIFHYVHNNETTGQISIWYIAKIDSQRNITYKEINNLVKIADLPF